MQAEASIIQLICCTIGAERGRAPAVLRSVRRNPRHFKLTNHFSDEAMTEQIIRRAGGRSARRSARNAPSQITCAPYAPALKAGDLTR